MLQASAGLRRCCILDALGPRCLRINFRMAMSSRRIIKGVLHNFLVTFTSRYSDFEGYWVFGFLVADMDTVAINLLDASTESADDKPLTFAKRLAVQRFAEQIAKAGLPTRGSGRHASRWQSCQLPDLESSMAGAALAMR